MAKGDFAIAVAWETKDELMSALGARSQRAVEREIDQRLEYYAPRIEAFMKTTAPWTDRTGNARNGLAARAYKDRSERGIILYHQVPYGIWLEVANEGRFAVIIPTIESMGPDVMRSLDGLLDRIRP